MGECACGNDLIYAGVGPTPSRCGDCRRDKKPLPRVAGKTRLLDLKVDHTKTLNLLSHNRRRVKQLKAKLAYQQKRLDELKGVKRALVKVTKDRDKHLKMLVEQGTMLENYGIRTKALKAQVARLEGEVKVAAAPAAPAPTSKKVDLVAAVPCPSCKKAARVVWRRTASFDLLEGKCNHCGHHMNSIQAHGVEGVG